MVTRFMYKALALASLGIALSVLLAAPSAASPASSNAAGELQLDPPAAPSHCKTRFVQAGGKFFFGFTVVSWRDNSTNEDGFILETWRKQAGTWVPAGSIGTQPNSASVSFPGSFGSNYKFRVKAFNAAGDSAWSNWGH